MSPVQVAPQPQSTIPPTPYAHQFLNYFTRKFQVRLRPSILTAKQMARCFPAFGKK
eukprot:SAG22_NODE_713_length_7726_cov_10.328701_3_plen_56_part_00